MSICRAQWAQFIQKEILFDGAGSHSLWVRFVTHETITLSSQPWGDDSRTPVIVFFSSQAGGSLSGEKLELSVCAPFIFNQSRFKVEGR